MPSEQALGEWCEVLAPQGQLRAERDVIKLRVIQDRQLRGCFSASPKGAAEVGCESEPTIQVIGSGDADTARVRLLVGIYYRVDGVQPGIRIDVGVAAKELKLWIRLVLRTRSIP